MEHISKELKIDNIQLKKINYEDFKKIFEYDYKHLAGVWFDKVEYIYNSAEEIDKLYKEITKEEKSFGWLIYQENIPVRNYMCR